MSEPLFDPLVWLILRSWPRELGMVAVGVQPESETTTAAGRRPSSASIWSRASCPMTDCSSASATSR